MSETETMSSPNDWLHFYQQNFPAAAAGQLLPSVSDATTVTNTLSATTPPLGLVGNTDRNSMLLNNSSISSSPTPTPTPTPSQLRLSPEGGVSKPIRRRSRASRRTPTTLLNTDTTNFRAMVQQFTGGSSVPFASSPSVSVFPNLGLGFGSRSLNSNPNPNPNPSGLMLAPSTSGYHHLQQQNQHYYTYNHGNGQGRSGIGIGDNTFVQRPPPPNVTTTDHHLTDHGHGGRSFFPSPSPNSA